MSIINANFFPFLHSRSLFECMKKCCLLLTQVYSPNVYSYSTYLSGYTPLRHYTPISSYSYHLPTYNYDYSLPGSLYLPSAVPIRYYSRSSPVRVVTSPLSDYVSPRIYSINVRPSIIHREMMRIEHKTRPRYGYDPTEEYLNSASAKVGLLTVHLSLPFVFFTAPESSRVKP